MLDELLQDKIKLDIPASNQDKMKVLPEQENYNLIYSTEKSFSKALRWFKLKFDHP